MNNDDQSARLARLLGDIEFQSALMEIIHAPKDEEDRQLQALLEESGYFRNDPTGEELAAIMTDPGPEDMGITPEQFGALKSQFMEFVRVNLPTAKTAPSGTLSDAFGRLQEIWRQKLKEIQQAAVEFDTAFLRSRQEPVGAAVRDGRAPAPQFHLDAEGYHAVPFHEEQVCFGPDPAEAVTLRAFLHAEEPDRLKFVVRIPQSAPLPGGITLRCDGWSIGAPVDPGTREAVFVSPREIENLASVALVLSASGEELG